MTSKQALVVDDSRSARKVLERMLQKADLTVTTMEDAESALAYLQHETPSIIFMDHMMPGMNGLEATAELRKLSNLQQVPTIMYTSKDDADYLAQAKAHGADDVLPKPAKQDRLESLIATYLVANVETVDVQQLQRTSQQTSSQQTSASESASLSQEAQDPYQSELPTEPTSANQLNEVQVQALISKALIGVSSDWQQHLNHQLSDALNQLAEQQTNQRELAVQQLETKIGQQAITPSAMFKTLQPVLQKLTIQVATKVTAKAVNEASSPLAAQLDEAQSRIEDLQTRMGQQNRHHAGELQQLKLISYGGLALAGLSFAGAIALLVGQLL